MLRAGERGETPFEIEDFGSENILAMIDNPHHGRIDSRAEAATLGDKVDERNWRRVRGQLRTFQSAASLERCVGLWPCNFYCRTWRPAAKCNGGLALMAASQQPSRPILP